MTRVVQVILQRELASLDPWPLRLQAGLGTTESAILRGRRKTSCPFPTTTGLLAASTSPAMINLFSGAPLALLRAERSLDPSPPGAARARSPRARVLGAPARGRYRLPSTPRPRGAAIDE